MKTISLKDFYAIYAVSQGFDHIPKIHEEMLEALEKKDYENNTLIIQAFRNSAKSTLTAPYIVWTLVDNPNHLFLIQSADDDTAMKTVADCRKIITTHPLALKLREKNHVWNSRKITVSGSNGGRNTSISARGIFSNVTGSRADTILFDDVEVPRNVGNAEMRTKLRERISESVHLLQPGGTRIFVGTPHSWESIYPELIEKGATSVHIPLLRNMEGEFPNYTGTSSWPERWTPEEIQRKQINSRSKQDFLAQNQLIPVSTEEATLEPDLIQIYDNEIEILDSNRSTLIRLGDKILSAVACYWDVSLSTGSRDDSVIALAYTDTEGHIYLHRLYQVSGDVELQCDKVKEFLIKHRIPSIRVETNGLGGFVPQILIKKTRGLDIAVEGKQTNEDKANSILTAYSTPLSGKFFWCHKSILDTKFTQQMRDFNPRRMHTKNDFIDSGAKAVNMLPVRIGRGAASGNLKGFTPARFHNETYEAEFSSSTW